MDRTITISELTSRIKAEIPEFRLVKAYEGEFAGGDERFLANIRGLLPCCLVVSESVEKKDGGGRRLELRQEIALIVVEKDFTGADEVPRIYDLLDQLIEVLHNHPVGASNYGMFRFMRDRHIGHNDYFTAYEQSYGVDFVA